MRISKAWEILTRKEKKNSRIMRRAWTIAKIGKIRFGGSSKDYLSLSMKEAWSLEGKPIKNSK